jgi:hypothetical protein
MNSYTRLLTLAADEVRLYLQNNRPTSPPAAQWDGLARTIEDAAKQETDEATEQTMKGIARHLIDEFPLNQEFSLNFWKAMDALERKKRQMRRTTGSRLS